MPSNAADSYRRGEPKIKAKINLPGRSDYVVPKEAWDPQAVPRADHTLPTSLDLFISWKTADGILGVAIHSRVYFLISFARGFDGYPRKKSSGIVEHRVEIHASSACTKQERSPFALIQLQRHQIGLDG